MTKFFGVMLLLLFCFGASAVSIRAVETILLQNAAIVLTAPNGKVYRGSTDQLGNLTLDVPVGVTYKVTVSSSGYQALTFKWNPDQGKEYFTQIKLSKTGKTGKSSFELGEAGNLRLVEGWNLITLALVPVTPLQAADLVKMINQQGGLAMAVSRWSDGRWQSYLPELAQNNFEMVPGGAYFVQNLRASRLKIAGQVLTQPIKVPLQPGWNPVGLPQTAVCLECTGKKLLSLTSQLAAISTFNSGLWQTLAHDQDVFYGLDFPLESTSGYFVKAISATTLEP